MPFPVIRPACSGQNPARPLACRFSSPGLYLAIVATLTPQISQAQFRTWNSASNTDWNTPGHWSPADVPNTTGEFALFNSAGLANPAVNANTTVAGIFVQAGNYTIGGSGGTLTIDPNTTSGSIQFSASNNSTLVINRNLTTINSAQSITSRVETTPGSTVTFAAGNTWTSTTGIAFQDLTNSAGGTFNFNGALNLGGNFVQAFGPFGNPTGVFNFNPTSVTASAGGIIQHLGGSGRINLMADFAQAEVHLGNNAFLSTTGVAETYLTTNGMSMSRPVRQIGAGSVGTGNSVFRYGVDIAGTGSATQAGPITLNANGAGFAGQNYTLALDVRLDDTFIVTGVINELGTPVRHTLSKTGPGTLRLEGSANNAWTIAPFVIEEGTVVLGRITGANTIPAGIVTTVNSGARLEIAAADQIQNTADLRLSGGTMDTNGFSETLDQLTITQASTLDFGTGATTLTFGQLASGTGTLTIDNWSGNLAGGGTDQLRFSNVTGLATYLPNVNFTGYAPGAVLIGNEVVPFGAVPEPGVITLLGTAGVFLVRRTKPRRRNG